jgi:hypothetical protein
MRVKWRIVVSFNAVLATHRPGSTYHSFSQYDCERKARATAGRSNARWDSRRATGSASGSTSGLATALCSRYKILVQGWSRLLKHWHSRRYNHGLIRRRSTVWAVGRNVGQSRGGRLCQLICSRFAISRLHRGWLSVWQCCRRRATHLPKTINAGFAPAMFSGFVHRKSRAWSVLPPACTSSGPA